MVDRGLVGRRLEVVVSDPWEFGTQHGDHPRLAVVVRAGVTANGYGGEADALLLRWLEPVVFQGVKCEFFVATARHEAHGLDELERGRNLPVSIIRISSAQAASDAPLDLSWWRGGVALLGDVRSAR
jgi:hypothetical protein